MLLLSVTLPPALAGGAFAAMDASFVSYSNVPTTLTVGETRTVSVTMKNTGTSTWTAATGYALGSKSSPTGVWGLNHVSVSGSVAPNATHTFTFAITAPSTAGSYTFQWRMLQSGEDDRPERPIVASSSTVWFGSSTTSRTITVAAASTDGASFVSYADVPATMTVGETATVSVTMENTGTSTWTSAAGYKLGSQGPKDNTTWGLNRVAVSGSVAAKAPHTFTFEITAPSTAGSYTFSWKMLKEGVAWFGSRTTSQTITVKAAATNDAAFVSYSGVPTTMTVGETKTVSVTMENTGTSTWTAGGGYKLGSQGPKDNTTWGLNRVAVSGSVASKAPHTFTFEITAPSTAGSYTFSWRMLKEGVAWFGSTTTSQSITVSEASQPPVDDASFVSYSGVPATMTVGETATVSVKMENTGTSTWTAGGGYKLGSQGPKDNTTWGLSRVALSKSVAAKAPHTFTFEITAPSTAGSYTFSWKMLREGVAWFGQRRRVNRSRYPRPLSRRSTTRRSCRTRTCRRR